MNLWPFYVREIEKWLQDHINASMTPCISDGLQTAPILKRITDAVNTEQVIGTNVPMCYGPMRPDVRMLSQLVPVLLWCQKFASFA